MNVVILASGTFPRRAYPLYLLSHADRLVCCDGTLHSVIRHSLRPDVLIGDLDSLPAGVRRKIDAVSVASVSGAPATGLDSASGAEANATDVAEVPDTGLDPQTADEAPDSESDSSNGAAAEFSNSVTLPFRLADGSVFPLRFVHVTEQDSNDLSKALRFVLSTYRDITSITILGATGRREAHTIGNLSLLMEYEKRYHFWEKGIETQMVSDYSTAFAVGDSCRLQVGEGRAVSLFTCDPSLKVRSEGLEWPLDEVVFDNWWRATLNRATADEIVLNLSHPAPLLIILD